MIICRVYVEFSDSSPLPKTRFYCICAAVMAQNARKVLVKLFQKLARSNRVGLAPVATGQTLQTVFLFCLAFLFAPFASKRKAAKTSYVVMRLSSFYL